MTDDFKTFNTIVNKLKNCMACSLASLLEFDIEILMNRLLTPFKLYDLANGIIELICFEKIKKAAFIDYTASPDFFHMHEINSYLKEHAGQLENKNLYLSLG